MSELIPDYAVLILFVLTGASLVSLLNVVVILAFQVERLRQQMRDHPRNPDSENQTEK